MIKLQSIKTLLLPCRTYKNFGHKRQPVPTVTILWQGFLTMTFIGLGIEWKRIARLLFGDNQEKNITEPGLITEKSSII